MRSKLTPDASKLVIATAGGYLMVVHNLDLETLSEDLSGFKPNFYRLMQMSGSALRYVVCDTSANVLMGSCMCLVSICVHSSAS